MMLRRMSITRSLAENYERRRENLRRLQFDHLGNYLMLFATRKRAKKRGEPVSSGLLTRFFLPCNLSTSHVRPKVRPVSFRQKQAKICLPHHFATQNGA